MDTLKPPILQRRGRIVAPGLLGAGWSDHCQMPTPYRLDDTTIRMFFSSRDAQNQSQLFWMDIEATPPFAVKRVADRPALAQGPLGSFDSHGVMPTAVVERDGALWMYYIGWTVRADVPYHNAIGVARSLDGGKTFERFLPGPVIGTGPHEPYFCGTGDIAKHGDRWVMRYMSATGWRMVAGKPEPRYHLKQAWSEDGIHWDQSGEVAVDYLDEDEGGIARATVLSRPDGYWMWFCHRGIADYRGRGARAYRLGLAWSPDGETWQRLTGAQVFDTPPSAGAFDAHMECYPAIFETAGETYLFYNGSDFGQTGIGYATLKESTSR